MNETCPCGSEKEYAACCEPVITGEKKARTAEELMRSRYTAYVKDEIEYIGSTMHPERRDEFDEKSAHSWAAKSVWHGLEVVSTDKGGPEDEEGVVEFVAHYTQKNQRVRHHERAEFKKEEETWYFVDGEAVPQETIRREGPKVGRNDPCPCGSGKKYKKCCA